MRSLRHVFLRTLVLLCTLVLCFSLTHQLNAATLYVSPSTVTVRTGDIFTVSVRADSEGEAINAVSAKLVFPKQLLQATTTSKTGSILNYWTQNPIFSNTLGTASFEGVAVNPGYTGSSGKVVSVSFRAIKEGTANLTLTQASILANDGEGTNVLIAVKKGIVDIIRGIENKISIISSTHPDALSWYVNNNVSIVLSVPEKSEAMRYSFDKDKDTFSKDEVVTKTVIDETLADGVWYFHAQAKVSGVWGNMLNVPINIDNTPPTIILSFDETAGTITPFAIDETSGIAKVTAKSGGEEKEIQNNTAGVYDLNSIFTAYDNAGNTSFVKLTSASDLVITDAPTKAIATTNFFVNGIAGGGDKVSVYAKKIKTVSNFSLVINYNAISTDVFDKEFYAVVGEDKFSASISDLSPGPYAFFAKNSDGEVSNIVIVTIFGGLWSKIWAFIMLWWYIPLLFLLLLLIIFILRKIIKNIRENKGPRPVRSQTPIISTKTGDRYTTLLQKIELGVPLNLEERLFIQKLKRYLHTEEDPHH